jgi:putative hydroxymethylpyrimidine transport system substrate-binding protein
MRWLLAVAAVLALAGCGEKQEPSADAPVRQEPFTVMLDYTPNADHAGLYAALDQGLYKNAGLDVKLQTPPDPSSVLKLVSAGKADLAISYEPDLLLARDQGAEDLVAVAALVQVPLTSLVSLPESGVKAPQDLAGKRVATSGLPYQSAYLRTILQKAGVDPASVKETNVGFNLEPALISKRADAVLGAFWNVEGVNLEREGHKPIIQRMEKLGVPTYDELILVARRQDLDAAGASRLRRFLSATAQGTRLLTRDPNAGLQPLLKADKSLDEAAQAASLKVTLPAFFPEDKAKPWGWMEPVDWANYERWMRANNLLKRPPSEAPPLTNEFLGSEPPDPNAPPTG